MPLILKQFYFTFSKNTHHLTSHLSHSLSSSNRENKASHLRRKVGILQFFRGKEGLISLQALDFLEEALGFGDHLLVVGRLGDGREDGKGGGERGGEGKGKCFWKWWGWRLP